MKFSLIMTVKNEGAHLPAWFASIQKQTVQPDEMVIVDGGSMDTTWELLSVYAGAHPNCRILQKQGNISTGRNVAITHATGEVVVATDAGCTYDPTWFATITAPFATPSTSFVTTAHAPWLTPDDTLATVLIAAATIPARAEFARDWPPSSRSVAFRRSVWSAVGGYPEWLPICEDVVFDAAVTGSGVNTLYIREPLVAWRPRTTLVKYLRQVFLYTRGDGHARLFLVRQLIRYSVYAGAVVLCILSVSFHTLWPIVVLVFAGMAYMKKFWLRYAEFTHGRSPFFRFFGIILLPFIVAIGDVAKMIGWPVGVWERISKKIHAA